MLKKLNIKIRVEFRSSLHDPNLIHVGFGLTWIFFKSDLGGNNSGCVKYRLTRPDPPIPPVFQAQSSALDLVIGSGWVNPRINPSLTRPEKHSGRSVPDPKLIRILFGSCRVDPNPARTLKCSNFLMKDMKILRVMYVDTNMTQPIFPNPYPTWINIRVIRVDWNWSESEYPKHIPKNSGQVRVWIGRAGHVCHA